MIWLWMYNTEYGLLNYLLAKVHLPPVAWLGEKQAMPSLALMSVWGVGNTVIIYLAGLQDVPRELLEAAEIDGAGPCAGFSPSPSPSSPRLFSSISSWASSGLSRS